MEVSYKVLGAKVKTVELERQATVGDLKAEVGLEKYTASVNGQPASDTHKLQADDYVTLSEAVKGGI